MLVGGTALAGYYAGHRRSDDLDIFTGSPRAQEAAVLAVRSLAELGCAVTHQGTSARFSHATCRLAGHDFTTQVVLDSHLFAVGSAIVADDGVAVADLETLLKMKAATLVSRAAKRTFRPHLAVRARAATRCANPDRPRPGNRWRHGGRGPAHQPGWNTDAEVRVWVLAHPDSRRGLRQGDSSPRRPHTRRREVSAAAARPPDRRADAQAGVGSAPEYESRKPYVATMAGNPHLPQ